jgi:hypothetical protein
MCRTCSKHMYHPFGNDTSHINLWDAWFPNSPTYFGHHENYGRCVLSDVCLCTSFIHDFGSINLLFSSTPISDVWSKNNVVMLSKSQMEDTQGRHQITRDNCYSYVDLEHILPIRILTCHLSSLTSCISFRSIEYDSVSLRLEPFHLLTMIGVICVYWT